jgi:hypothetical protein
VRTLTLRELNRTLLARQMQFTSFKVRQIAPALEGARTFEDEHGHTLYDVPRAALAPETTKAPVRFLPPFDSIILAHRDRSRILPDA